MAMAMTQGTSITSRLKASPQTSGSNPQWDGDWQKFSMILWLDRVHAARLQLGLEVRSAHWF